MSAHPTGPNHTSQPCDSARHGTVIRVGWDALVPSPRPKGVEAPPKP
jgi:hypothetical protein